MLGVEPRLEGSTVSHGTVEAPWGLMTSLFASVSEGVQRADGKRRSGY